MDLIFNKNKTPFTVDGSLWIKALQKRPGYENLLGFEDLMNERGRYDDEDQAEIRNRFPTRDHYIRYYAPNIGAMNALAAWNADWAGHPNPPPNFVSGAQPMRWNSLFRDFAGEAKINIPAALGGGVRYFPRVTPPNFYQRRWLANNPNYGVVGFRGNPNNVIIQRRPPAAMGGAALVPFLPAANIGIY